MNIKKVNGEYECGKRDLFACMIALKYVMAQKEYVNMLRARVKVGGITRNIVPVPEPKSNTTKKYNIRRDDRIEM